MKQSFSAGLVILLPLALTIWVVFYLFDLFTNPLFQIIEKLALWYEAEQHRELFKDSALLKLASRIASLLLTFTLITILGLIGRRFFFQPLLKSMHRLISRIPLIGSIYKLTKEIAKALLSSEEKTFKEAVLVPFPSAASYSIGLVTGEAPLLVREKMAQLDTTIFVPTSPYPISGYILFCPKSSTLPIDISTEEVFKTILSCGALHPVKKSSVSE